MNIDPYKIYSLTENLSKISMEDTPKYSSSESNKQSTPKTQKKTENKIINRTDKRESKRNEKIKLSIENEPLFNRKHLSVIRNKEEGKDRRGSKSYSYTFNKKRHHSSYLNKLYERYEVIESNPSKEVCMLIDICEGQLSYHVHKYYKFDDEGRTDFYNNYYLGFYHHADPIICIDFINKILKKPLLQKNKKILLYKFAKKLLNNLKLGAGPKYDEWKASFSLLENASFQKHYTEYLEEMGKIQESILQESIDTNELIMETLRDLNKLTSSIKSYSIENIEYFVETLSHYTQYYLSFITDGDILDANNKGKEKISAYSIFFNDFLFNLLINYINTPRKDIKPKNQISIASKEFIEFIYQCLVYSTENNYQDVGLMIYAFVNNLTINNLKNEYASNKTKKIISNNHTNFEEYYSPINHFRAIRSNPNARWPLNVILNEQSRNSEQPILANHDTCLRESTIKLTNQQTIYNTGKIISLFRTHCSERRQVEQQIGEAFDFQDRVEICDFLQSHLDLKNR